MSSKKKTRNARLSREERLAQLLESGVHVAARLGLSRTVHAEVAKEAPDRDILPATWFHLTC